MRVNYLGLEAFAAVAELGSFSRAAARLNLSQTALSHRIRKIEEELGVRLLARTSRGVSLTKAGQRILPQVKTQLGELSAIMASLRDEGQATARRLTFACLPTISQYYLPGILADFAIAMPGVDVVLRDQPVAEIVNLVRNGEVEFGVTILGAGHWDLEAEPLGSEPYYLLVAKGHRLAAQDSVTLDDLAGEVMVRIRTQSTNRELVEVAIAPVRDRIRWRYEVQNAATALSLVATGAAVTVLPRLTADLTSGRLVGLPFADVDLSRRLGVLSRRGVPVSAAGQRLLAMIRARLAEG